jgi:hypothetical protein
MASAGASISSSVARIASDMYIIGSRVSALQEAGVATCLQGPWKMSTA